MEQQGVESSETDNGCLAIGLELGTSSSKFCAHDTIVLFSSVIGDPLSARQEKSWRLMNRSQDRDWIRNLAIFDDNRNSWRYVGAMTRNSEKQNWFTSKGVVQNFDDAFTSLKAGLFLLDMELRKNGNPGIKKAGLGFGIVVHLGEDIAEFQRGKEPGRDKKYLMADARIAKRVFDDTVRHAECAEHLLTKFVLSGRAFWNRLWCRWFPDTETTRCREILKGS